MANPTVFFAVTIKKFREKIASARMNSRLQADAKQNISRISIGKKITCTELNYYSSWDTLYIHFEMSGKKHTITTRGTCPTYMVSRGIGDHYYTADWRWVKFFLIVNLLLGNYD